MVKIVVVVPPKRIEDEEDRKRIEELLDRVGEEEPDIICLPEAFANWVSNPEPIPGPITNMVAKKTRKYGMYAIAPVLEQRDKLLYNTAAIIDRSGEILGTYSKTHLTPGESFEGIKTGDNLPVFDTDFGRIAIMICYDIYWPEIARVYALKGAEILFWAGAPQGWSEFEMASIFCTMVIDNCLYGVLSHHVAQLIPVDEHASQSMRWSIITPDGHVLAGRYDASGGIIAADVDLARRRLIKERGETVDLRGYLFQSRRPELYGLISQKYEVSPDGFYGTENYETIRNKTFATMKEVYEALTQPVKAASETPSPPSRKARVAVVCLEERSLEKGIAIIDEAARCKPDLICLPQDFAGTNPEPIPGPTTEKIFRKAKQYGTYIVAPQRERNGLDTYASAMVCDREGKLLGVYREMHLTGEQRAEGLKPGENISPFDTDFGRIGVMLGFDFFFPEVSRILTLKGVRALFWPTTEMPEWPGQQTLQTMLMGRAFAYKTYVAMASYGEKTETPHIPFKIRRKSCIIDLDGQPIADTSFRPGIADALIDLSSDFYCSVGPIPSASYRHKLLRERRPELYAQIAEGTIY